MKRLINFLPVIAIFTLLLHSCEDNETSPLSVPADGVFVTVDIINPVIDVTDIANSSYSGTLKDPVGNVASHTFSVRKVTGTSATDYADVYTTTSFPSDFSLKASDIFTALGLNVSDVLPGDRFDFVGTSVGVNGSITTYNSLNADLKAETGQKQAYRLTTYISCPFVSAEAVGTWLITDDPFDASILGDIGQAETFEVVAGPGANQVTFIDVFGHARFNNLPSPGTFDVVVDIDPGSGIVTVNEKYDDEFQYAWDPANYGLPYSLAWLKNGSGFLFSCAGAFTVDWTHDVTIGTYGSRHFEAQKQ